MDFVKLYEKKIKKREQQEDYITELIAFICRTSNDFKEFYLNAFLNLNLTNIELIRIETQVRSPNEKSTDNIPDFIIYEENKVICVCEHKIDSDINCKDDKNTQLDDYFLEFGDKCKYILIKPEFKLLKNFADKHKKIWITKTWQNLFLFLKNNYYDGALKDYFEFDSLEDFKSKNKIDDINIIIVFFLMDFFEEFELYDFDLLDYNSKYNNIPKLLDKTIESVNKFYLYKDILKKIKGKTPKSEISTFIEEAIIYTNNDGEFDYYGFYGWADSFYLLRWKGAKYFPFSISEDKILRIKKEFNKEDIDLSSIKKFNNQYDKTQENLDKFNMFFSKIINRIKFELEKEYIVIDVSKIKSDKELGNISFESKVNNVDIQFEICKEPNKLFLFFDKSNLTDKQISKIRLPFKKSEDDDGWSYFAMDVNNLKFISKDIDKIIKFYVESIQSLNFI